MLRFSLPCIALLALAACSPSPSPQSRVAARVNGEAIPVAEFQMVVSQAGRTAQKPAPAAVMESLIDRKLFAQKALALKYDQQPQVALLLDAAKESVLAQAYIASLADWSREDDEAVAAFYEKNRDLFEKRRIYRVVEIAVAASPELIARLKQRAMHARDLYGVVTWLKAQGLPYNLGAVAKPSEQLAPPLLSHLTAMREGEIAIMEVTGGASVLQLLQSDPAPLTREAAAPLIERALRARKQAELAEAQRKYLHTKAHIEYVVDLGQDGGRPPESPTTTATGTAPLP